MRRYALLLGSVALMASVTLPAAAKSGTTITRPSAARAAAARKSSSTAASRCFERWRYAGGASIKLQRDGTLKTGPGAPGLGVLWYAARPYGDFILQAAVP